MKPHTTIGQNSSSPKKDGKPRHLSPTNAAPIFPNFQNGFQRTSPVRMSTCSPLNKTHSPRKNMTNQHEYSEAASQEDTTTNFFEATTAIATDSGKKNPATLPLRNFDPWGYRFKNVSQVTCTILDSSNH
jgi:hypothetical protein